MAVWTKKYVDSLPNSSFAYIDGDGNRHLPYKDASGKVDQPHVRAALSRASQVKGLSGEALQKVMTKLRNVLAKANSNTPRGFVHQLSELNPSSDVIQIMLFGEWEHPLWGVERLTRERGERFKENFDNNVLGHKITFDYEHKRSFAHGTKASAELKAVEVRDDGLYGHVDWTPQALQEIESGEWLYFSPEYVDVLERDGDNIEDVLVGGGLTNSPVIHGIAPINCSTVFPDLEDDVKAEYADWEHSEPGTGTPPQPGETGDLEPAPFYDPDESTEQDNTEAKVDEKELRALLGLSEDANINEVLTGLKADADAFKAATASVEMSNIPQELKDRLEKLESDNLDNAAKAFSADYVSKGVPPAMREGIEEAHKALSKVGATAQLSAVLDAMPKIKLGDERGSAAGGTVGGGNADIPEGDEARKQFAAIQTQLAVTETNGDMRKAFSLAAAQNPELFKNAQDTKTKDLTRG